MMTTTMEGVGASVNLLNGAHAARVRTLLAGLERIGVKPCRVEGHDPEIRMTCAAHVEDVAEYAAGLTFVEARDGALSPEAYLRWKATR